MEANRKSRNRAMLALLCLAGLGVLAGCSSGAFDSLLGGGGAIIRPLGVADFGNNRATIYQPPFTNNQAATKVLGQPDATSSGTGTTATTLNAPNDVALDAAGNALVAD